MSGGFTEEVRQELSRVPVTSQPAAVAELGVLLRLAGRLHRTGTATGSETAVELSTRSGAVLRRVFLLLERLTEARPELWVRAPGGMEQATTYGATFHDVEPLARRLGLLDDTGRPLLGLPAAADGHTGATIRAALLATGSVSAPGRPVHAEFGAPGEQSGRQLANVLQQVSGRGRLVVGTRVRVVIKSSPAVMRILEESGATVAAARWAERRSRLRARNEATRLANADAANLRRTIDAASDQVALVERVVARVGWRGLEEDLRAVALARLANPTASLAELGELCDPPVGKSAVHRRLQRLRALAEAPSNTNERGHST